ncbi:SDR family oxidoreductase [Rhizobium sp. XQZ8]|uniref:SDR family NAD(P)-dependent oxidoreductase n=1 Tax=Rhizobium populisoli TaxID=2859785 RepID=UPI001C669FC7|nr:SDR family oxidoreductase [Rhizobium populisoli]MBW6424350.1 SDR family oxidoreductase [Rhizobium populisoli]
MGSRKSVIITGAGSGIGAATAITFAANGYDVAVNYSRNRTGANEIVEQCRTAGVDAVSIRGDIAEDDDCRTIADMVMSRFGRIDALVNNAGVTRQAPAEDLEASNVGDFDAIFRVNVAGTYQMIRAAAPHLRQAGLGSIVNVSSDSALSGSGSSLAYAASKGALNTMTRGLARTLSPAIRVNAVCPGFVDTTWALAWHDEASYRSFKAELIAKAPLKSMPEATDIAEAIFWLTDKAHCVTGQCMVIDSGAGLVE